jgi:hypothetical protein
MGAQHWETKKKSKGPDYAWTPEGRVKYTTPGTRQATVADPETFEKQFGVKPTGRAAGVGLSQIQQQEAVSHQTGREDVAGAKEVAAEREATAAEQMVGAEEQMEGIRTQFGEAETAIEKGYQTTEAAIEATRTKIDAIPGQIREDIAAGQAQIDDSLRTAEGLIGAAREEALSGVYAGYGSMLQTATSNAHAQQEQNRSELNAMVATGQLSRAQAAQMEAQFNTQSNMNIAASIGEVSFNYSKLATDTQVQFGEMLTNLEVTGVGVTGTFQGVGAQEISATERAVGDMNLQLTDQLASAANQRSTNLGMLTEARAAAEASFGEYQLAMLPELHQPFVPASVVEYNSLFNQMEILRTSISAEQAELYRADMETMQEQEAFYGTLDAIGGILGAILPG